MFFKIIFTWWNRQTIGTFFKTLFFGKYVGTDEHGNKYYTSKQNERWVIYSKNIEATKIKVTRNMSTGKWIPNMRL